MATVKMTANAKKSTVKTTIQKKLFSLRDEQYRAFQQKIVPSIDKDKIIGVRTPLLRAFAKELYGTPTASQFLRKLPHRYFEEDILHAFLLERVRDFDDALSAVNAFLPYVDNWATCDQLSPKAFKKNLPALYAQVKVWIASGKTYIVRYGIGTLLKFFLNESFSPAQLKLVASVKSGEYYVNMIIAWYFATALAKQYDAAIPYIEKKRLAPWTHNKTIQKACESLRVSEEKKAHLKGLKLLTLDTKAETATDV